MAEKRTYSHISVGQEDQDQVIYAGVRPQAAPESGPAVAVGAAVVAEPEGAAAVVAEPEPAAEPEAPAAVSPKAAAKPAVPKKERFQEQTLEDLEAEPMSGLQKGVLAAAALFVVAFAVYWFVLRPMGA
ncbi:MAG: SURF2 Surfeit locus protein 2 [Coriobacteriia bacterium]|nr:SURF2 Surfeit locus protein 2 [Coriobacteriia bacterium]